MKLGVEPQNAELMVEGKVLSEILFLNSNAHPSFVLFFTSNLLFIIKLFVNISKNVNTLDKNVTVIY